MTSLEGLWDPKAMRVHIERYHPVERVSADGYCRTDARVVFSGLWGSKVKAAE